MKTALTEKDRRRIRFEKKWENMNRRKVNSGRITENKKVVSKTQKTIIWR